MHVRDVASLYDYTTWANERMLEAAAGLSEEQFTREIVSSFSSIADTFAHIAFAEWLWLRRWKGDSPTQRPDWERTLASLGEQIRLTADERDQWIGSLTDSALSENLTYRNLAGDSFTFPLGDLLLHCANHSTYHRGQLTTMLRQVGARPPATDYVAVYKNARG